MMFLANPIVRESLAKNVAASFLKSIGGFLRVNVDIPKNQPELRRKSLYREISVLLMTFATGILLDVGFRFVPPALRRNAVMKFAPQAAAIFLAEMASRKLTNYNEAVQHALGPKADTPSVSAPAAEEPIASGDRFGRQSDGHQHIRFAPFHNKMFRTEQSLDDHQAVVFQARMQYHPMMWSRHHSQFSPMARFY